MKSIEVDGPTVADATELGASVLGISPDEAVVEILRNAPPGDAGAAVRVRVSKRQEQNVSQETPVADDSPAPSQGMFPGKQAVLETFELILGKLGIAPRLSFKDTPEGFLIDVAGDGAALVIGRHGQTLEAVEYVLNRIAGNNRQDAPRILLDVEGYRERREEALAELAASTAVRVRESGRPVVLQPMSPRDRRLVHVLLQEDPTVETHSEGDGPFRTLVVSPKRSTPTP
jgi:spoIIIJ-associated protein